MSPNSPLPSYSQRHLDPAEAARYRGKFGRGPLRRLSARRELALVRAALRGALERVPSPAPVLLDYPCGAGRFAALFAGRVGGYLAGDHSPHMLAITSGVLAEAGLAERLVGTTAGDARSMQLEDDSVDLAACIRLLHHFPERADRVRILAELRRVARGPLVTSFLDAESFKQRRHVARCAKRGKPSRRVLQSEADFRAEAAEAGWRLVERWSLSGLFSGQSIALLEPAPR